MQFIKMLYNTMFGEINSLVKNKPIIYMNRKKDLRYIYSKIVTFIIRC